MLNCDWAASLTKYDCLPVNNLHGEPGVEIGTPFALHGGAAVVVYCFAQGSHQVFSDDGDTLIHLSGLGLDVWHGARLKAIREVATGHNVTLSDSGCLTALARPEHAPFVFAQFLSAVLAMSRWAETSLQLEPQPIDLAAEAEPYIVARNPAWFLKRDPAVRGASHNTYRFDFLHGPDLIDVVGPSAQSTGGVMRKVGDIINGPFLGDRKTLIIVDDRTDPQRAAHEISILGSLTRAMPFTRLVQGATH
jgi:Domain of unknown function DUF1828